MIDWIQKAGLCALALACSAVSLGCAEERSELWERALEPRQARTVGDDVAYYEPNFERVTVLRPSRSDVDPYTLGIERVATPSEPGILAQSADGRELYIVGTSRAPQLQILRFDDEGTVTQTRVDLAGGYDRIEVDPLGEFLILGYRSEIEPGRIVARNANEIAILDLRSPESEPVVLTLASRAERFVFAPAFDLDGSSQRLVAALSDREIMLLDLLSETEGDRQRVVPLTLSEADAERPPRQALFDVSRAADGGVSLFVLSQSSVDITELAIASSSGERKLDLSVNQLAAGPRPRRMALLSELEDRGARLLVVNGERPEFTIVDVESGQSASFELPMDRPGEEVLLFTVEVEGGSRLEERALVWSRDSPLVAFLRPEAVAIAGDAPTLGRSVEALRIKAAPARIEHPEVGNGLRAVAFHAGLNEGFTVLDLGAVRDVPIDGGTVSDLRLGSTFAYGVFPRRDSLGLFDLGTGGVQIAQLPAAGRRIYTDVSEGLLLVEHDDERGLFTVLDAAGPTPENACVFQHVFVDGLFELELP